MQIKATLRNGSEYVLVLEGANAEPTRIFDELIAGRSQALRGWVRVQTPDQRASVIAVLGSEIVELHLIGDGPASQA